MEYYARLGFITQRYIHYRLRFKHHMTGHIVSVLSSACSGTDQSFVSKLIPIHSASAVRLECLRILISQWTIESLYNFRNHLFHFHLPSSSLRTPANSGGDQPLYVHVVYTVLIFHLNVGPHQLISPSFDKYKQTNKLKSNMRWMVQTATLLVQVVHVHFLSSDLAALGMC